jgi:hypothetical protein
MLRDHKLLHSQSIQIAAKVTGGSPYNGTGVDLAACEAATVVFQVGTVSDGTHTPKIQESNDNASFSDVAAGDQVGTLAVLASNVPQAVGYRGAMRYIRPVITSAGTTTGAIAGAHVIRGHQHAADA